MNQYSVIRVGNSFSCMFMVYAVSHEAAAETAIFICRPQEGEQVFIKQITFNSLDELFDTFLNEQKH